MPKQAYYHREQNPALEVFIVKENDDKTVDLAREEKGAPFITGCVVTEQPEVGSCTLVPPAAPAPQVPGEPLVDPIEDKKLKKKN